MIKLASIVGNLTDKLNPQQATSGSDTTLPQNIFFNLTTTLTIILGVGAFISLIYGGIVYITAGANPERAELGKRVIIYSVIAIVVVLLAYIIYSTIGPAVESGSSALQ